MIKVFGSMISLFSLCHFTSSQNLGDCLDTADLNVKCNQFFTDLDLSCTGFQFKQKCLPLTKRLKRTALALTSGNSLSVETEGGRFKPRSRLF